MCPHLIFVSSWLHIVKTRQDFIAKEICFLCVLGTIHMNFLVSKEDKSSSFSKNPFRKCRWIDPRNRNLLSFLSCSGSLKALVIFKSLHTTLLVSCYVCVAGNVAFKVSRVWHLRNVCLIYDSAQTLLERQQGPPFVFLMLFIMITTSQCIQLNFLPILQRCNLEMPFVQSWHIRRDSMSKVGNTDYALSSFYLTS